MLHYAVHGGVPLISLQTTDTIHLVDFLGHDFGPCFAFDGTIASNRLYYTFESILGKDPPRLLVRKLTTASSVLIVVNPKEPIPEAFDAGVLSYPPAYVAERAFEAMGVALPVALVKGLTIKQTLEICRMVLAKWPVITPIDFMSVRSRLLGSRKGLFLVNTDVPFYFPDPSIENWLADNRHFFLEAVDPRLIPRGLLFSGTPGVGKSMAAKHIAKSLGVPLYRLDLSSSMSKWHGESEAAVASALASIDQESPCVMLLDEVEKLFSSTTEEVTSRILAQLLWWLLEHESRVLTVMTTNDLSKLPEELYRSGRIDNRMVLSLLDQKNAFVMATKLLNTFDLVPAKKHEMLKEIRAELKEWIPKITHAQVTAIVFSAIKKGLNKAVDKVE